LSRHALPDLTPHTLTTRDSVLRTLEAVRTAGYAIDKQEYAIGAVCAATPVLAGDVVGAVAVSLPMRRQAELTAVVQPLKYTAERTSRAIMLADLGGPEGVGHRTRPPCGYWSTSRRRLSPIATIASASAHAPTTSQA